MIQDMDIVVVYCRTRTLDGCVITGDFERLLWVFSAAKHFQCIENTAG